MAGFFSFTFRHESLKVNRSVFVNDDSANGVGELVKNDDSANEVGELNDVHKVT
jgi:hypothetical protein